jgi:hypothetical protein
MCFLCIGELHVAANNIKVLSVAQQCFYGEFTLLARRKCTSSCNVCEIFVLIVAKFLFSQQIFITVTNTKFHGNLSNESCTDVGSRQTGMMKLIGTFHRYVNLTIMHKRMMSHNTIRVHIMGKSQNRSHCHIPRQIMMCPVCVRNILVMSGIVQSVWPNHLNLNLHFMNLSLANVFRTNTKVLNIHQLPIPYG